MCCKLPLGMGPGLLCDWRTQPHSIGEICFSLQQVSITNSCVVMGEALCPLPLLGAGIVSGLSLPMSPVCPPLWVCMRVDPDVSGRHCFLGVTYRIYPYNPGSDYLLSPNYYYYFVVCVHVRQMFSYWATSLATFALDTLSCLSTISKGTSAFFRQE